jgi:hypothetical protein
MALTIKTAAERQAEALTAQQAAITRAIDGHIEARARALNYNSAAHLATYVNSTVPQWSAEAQAFIAWRDACWIAALQMLAEAQQTGIIPTAAQAIASLPEWPTAP